MVRGHSPPEINLARPEVHDALAPLLRRGLRSVKIPGLDTPVELRGTRFFATMNPSTIGGGRVRQGRGEGLSPTLKTGLCCDSG